MCLADFPEKDSLYWKETASGPGFLMFHPAVKNNIAYGYHIKGMAIKDMTDKLFQFTPVS